MLVYSLRSNLFFRESPDIVLTLVSLQSDPESVIYGQIMPFGPKNSLLAYLLSLLFKCFISDRVHVFFFDRSLLFFPVGSSARHHIAHVFGFFSCLIGNSSIYGCLDWGDMCTPN